MLSVGRGESLGTKRRFKLFSNEFGRTNDEIKTREGRFVDVSEREREREREREIVLLSSVSKLKM